jgi:hypothetical protein
MTITHYQCAECHEVFSGLGKVIEHREFVHGLEMPSITFLCNMIGVIQSKYSRLGYLDTGASLCA